MDMQQYLEQMKNIQNTILEFINNEQNEGNYQNLISFLNQEVKENQYKFRSFLNMISKISENYHQSPDFYDKIIKIISIFKVEIKQTFSNHEIFNIFKSNKRILLFLFEENILIPDEFIASFISTKKYQKRSYPHFFYPEFKKFFDTTFSNKIKEEISYYIDVESDSFNQQRKVGQNEAIICKLIREDSLNDFISYVSKNRIKFNASIDFSIFETNKFLYDKQPTIIEYTAFFGSIQIFKYLLSCEVKLKPPVWLYSIHGSNSEIIHILEEHEILPQDKIGLQIYDEPYEKCLIESIMCINNDFANYIQSNFIKKQEKLPEYALLNIKYFNYNGYPNDLQNEKTFYLFCKYDEPFFVDFLLKNGNIDINKVNVFHSFYFQMKF